MVNLFKCPRCKSEFYSAFQKNDFNCPYCGLIFALDSDDQRRHERLLFEKDCELAKGGVSVVGRTVDISKSGVGVEMAGATPFDKGDALSVTLVNLEIGYNVRVMWVSDGKDHQSRMGLKLDPNEINPEGGNSLHIT